MGRRRMKGQWALLVLLAAAGGVSDLLSQRAPGLAAVRDSVTVIPYQPYDVGWLHRWLLGTNHRPLWLKPIKVGVADLERIGGGLQAVKREGPDEARPFQFQAADGRMFGFRALVKDATMSWPPNHRTGFLSRLAKDQISSTVPAGALAVEVIEKAAGLISPGSELVVLPDDSRLGEWRSQFAHQVGTLELRLRASPEGLREVPGAVELLDSKDLYDTLRGIGVNRVDSRAYLTARLVDLLVGDWDRHEGQWTWARFDDRTGHRWVPIPSDRDWAFNRLDGPVWGLVRFFQPKFQKFDARLGGLAGLMIRSEALDRRLLVSLERSAWDSVVARFVSRVTDQVIAEAVAALPDGLDRAATTSLRENLKRRRNRLPMVAGAFYSELAKVVEVWGTDGPDRFTLDGEPDGSVRLSVEGGANAKPWVRRFIPGETKEIRLYALSGADRIVGAPAQHSILVRVVHEGGGALAVTGSSAGVKVYDSTQTFNTPEKQFSPEAMFRDWGKLTSFAPWVDQKKGAGFFLGGGPILTRYGFRRIPYASRLTARLAYTTGFSGINADFKADIRFENSGRGLLVYGAALTGDAVRYFGLGNETERPEASDFYVVRQQHYLVEPRLAFGLGGTTEFSIGGIARFSDSDEERPTLALVERPYGFGSFAEVGAGATFELDARDSKAYPTKGLRARFRGKAFPAIADVESAFGVLEGEVSAYVTATFLPARPTLAARAGGSRAWGNAPFFEAPSVGGIRSVRGYSTRRFLGDAAVYGGAEVRFDFGGFKVLVPGDWGIYALGDFGRVYRDAESSSRWHSALGGGLWLTFFDGKSAITFTYAKGREPGRLYVQSGFHF